MRRSTILALSALTLTSLSLFGANEAHAFINGGLETFIIASGEGEISSAGTSAKSDDETAYGITAYGLVSALPMIDAGLAIHYVPDVSFKDAEDPIGTEIDYNLRAAFVAPVPAIYLSVHAEAGLTTLSPGDNFSKNNDSSNLGYNYGAGARVGYSILPTLSLIVGADYQVYEVELFKGDIGTGEVTTDLKGSRIKATFGLSLAI